MTQHLPMWSGLLLVRIQRRRQVLKIALYSAVMAQSRQPLQTQYISLYIPLPHIQAIPLILSAQWMTFLVLLLLYSSPSTLPSEVDPYDTPPAEDLRKIHILNARYEI